ncbi:hypothetical protein BDN72DRAFT_340399 [Pluteus cervinus]|uniref:Uncharacterized protein n=1 Tax=Pluteus cervinus TaxID=181527 RepID=A0ACD3ABD5_9AGAR|nr:hypothetical protein BDN72DRAFT_340399 [Pluteus cervinus]
MIAVDIGTTYGALLIGGLFSAALCGILFVQIVLYFKLYISDSWGYKALVLTVWLLDALHSGFVWASIWNYLIAFFGVSSHIAEIPSTLPVTIVLTAILTFFVHCFFAHRIFRLSRSNWYITIPILVLAFCRLCSASVTGAEMLRLHTYQAFKAQFRWVFSLGLALSSAADVTITISLCMLLRSSRTRSLSLNHIIDSLILYTFETGTLTAAATIASMICWLTMNDNLVFMGLHFVIGKLYANSLLATLNSRHELRRAHTVVSRDAIGAGCRSPSSDKARLSPQNLRNGICGLQAGDLMSVDLERSLEEGSAMIGV